MVRLPIRTGKRSFALVATLALLAIATILLVIFVSSTGLDRSASYSYSQSVKADQVALGGLHLIVAQLQAEMSKDVLPDTNGVASPYVPLYTNISSANILPQANVTNSALPILVKMSTNEPFFTGTLANGGLQATTPVISTTAPSINGRSVSTNIWNQTYFGQYPNSASVPYWVLMTRNGPATAATFGASGSTANNSTAGNNSYVLGRIAYAIYDEGQLLDITTAGYPDANSTTPLSAAQLSQIKGTLAGADLTQVGITNTAAFIQWRNSASTSTASNYVYFVTNFASTNGYQQVYPGDSTFLSRQDLIKAAQSGTAGLTNTALPNLTTFTRELNAPSWAPSLNGSTGVPKAGFGATEYAYANNARTLKTSPFLTTIGVNTEGKQNPNPFIPFVRYVNGGTVTGYHSDGSTYTYTVNAGDSVVQHRFPLDRLNWVTPKGPSALLSPGDPFYNPGGTIKAIQACFGLYWAASENLGNTTSPDIDSSWSGIMLWKYVGSTATLPASETQVSTAFLSPIENLTDVANEAAGPREPNFFELLQAGVLSGSLGNNIGLASGSSGNKFQNIENLLQGYSDYQLLRIGANIISQVQPQAYPINIEYNQSGISLVASGVANLPYLSALKFAEGVDGATSGTSSTSVTPMATYGLVQLWNPHQQTTSGVVRPNVRLYIQGSVALGSGWATGNPALTVTGANGPIYGPTYTLATTTSSTPCYVQLVNTPGSSVGVNGFLNPFAITVGDVSTSFAPTPAYTSTTAGWTSSTSALTYQSLTTTTYPDSGVTYEALRFPNVNLTLQQSGSAIPGDTTNGPEYTGDGQVHFSTYLGGSQAGSSATAASRFQMMMKYQDPNDATGNTWIPYDYWSGNSSTQTWWTQFVLSGPTISPALNSAKTSVTGPPYAPLPTVDQTMHSTFIATGLRYHSGLMLNADPRTTRFSIFPMSGDDPNANAAAPFGSICNPMIDSIWSGSANTTAPFNICGIGGAGSIVGGAPGLQGGLNLVPTGFTDWFLPAYLPRNNTPLNPSGSNPFYANIAGTGPSTYFTAYQDPDGIQRIGDSGLFPTANPSIGTPSTGNPYYDPSDLASTSGQRTGDRPMILNRPFAGVGELGYVCRDNPWRSLDFFSVFNGVSTSADSGLLDLFTVTDSPNTVVAGRVDLNTKNPLVLQAILSGTTADSTGNTMNSPYNINNPAGMANALVNYTATNPLVNKDQLVTKFNPTLPTGGTASTPFGSTDEQNVKPFREAFVRSLADVGQARTWNLLIDLVAQAGKYPPSATTPDQFEVEGQRHYWLHVAVDRFTGKIIDRQLEVVGP